MEYARQELAEGLELWLATPEGVAPGEWETLFAQMAPQRQARCRRYAQEAHRRRCILADALARQALSHRLGIPQAQLHFARAPGGKPYAPGLPLNFSLSHSGSLVLCAVAPFPVGADIQRLRPVSPALLRRAVRLGWQGEGEEDFFRWWVRLEASSKLSGQGLSLAPIPQGLVFWDGEVPAADGSYRYSVCAWEGFSSGQ